MLSTTWRYEITLLGACPSSLRDLLGSRYGLDPVDPHHPEAVIIDDLDQASLRAVLSLFWDSGLSVVSVSSRSSRQQLDRP